MICIAGQRQPSCCDVCSSCPQSSLGSGTHPWLFCGKQSGKVVQYYNLWLAVDASQRVQCCSIVLMTLPAGCQLREGGDPLSSRSPVCACRLLRSLHLSMMKVAELELAATLAGLIHLQVHTLAIVSSLHASAWTARCWCRFRPCMLHSAAQLRGTLTTHTAAPACHCVLAAPTGHIGCCAGPEPGVHMWPRWRISSDGPAHPSLPAHGGAARLQGAWLAVTGK